MAEELEHSLRRIIRNTPWFMHALRAVRSVAPSKACIGSGAVRDAVSTWPETALAVAVGLREDDSIAITAPLGLDDLFSMVVRRNPRRVSVETYERRIAEKKYPDRWPGVRIVHD